MANVDNPHGFVPVKHLNGSPWNGMTNVYYVPTGASTIFTGSMVKLYTAGSTDGKYGAVDLCATTELPVGVVVSVVPDTSKNNTEYIATGSGGWVNVCDDPFVILEAQCDEAVTTALLSLNVSITNESGNTSTGRSTQELDISTAAASSALVLKMLHLADIPGNDVGANAKMLVKFNRHAYTVDAGSTAA